MFRKLDKLIVKAFVGPFIATFFITLLVLVMQFFWLYIDDFVGKGLSTGVILEFIWFQSAVLVPLALPLAVLLSSLMTFGNLGETYELVAIKSAGISLLRFMRPLFFVTLVICGIAFLFSNYIIPVANLKSRTLLSDIVYAKPAFDLKEGVFYDKISGFAIKVGKKEKNDSVIRDIIIYEQTNGLQDNFIVANNGVMSTTADKRFLVFHLKNGWRYQERGIGMNTEFIRLGFKEYKKQFDLSSFQFQRTADSVNKNNHRMLSMRQLDVAIDSIRKENSKFHQRVTKEVMPSLAIVQQIDSSWQPLDTPVTAKSFKELLADSVDRGVTSAVISKLEAIRFSNDAIIGQFKEQQRSLRLHQIEWHRKLSLSMACLVLFLIGAPLGSIIRKGGLGSPLVFSIVFFMIFYFLSNTGEKMAKEGSIHPFVGMWLSTFVLVPVGIFLIIKALNDSQLFNKEVYAGIWKSVRSWWLGRKQLA
ncbi:MAG TPA: LptF/LptG family permease [Chitinophagaceae bacterium]|nr:LptF/LptG family permease [Chitinophagaceae bacterium]